MFLIYDLLHVGVESAEENCAGCVQPFSAKPWPSAFKINGSMGVYTVDGREAIAKLIAVVLKLQPDAPIWWILSSAGVT